MVGNRTTSWIVAARSGNQANKTLLASAENDLSHTKEELGKLAQGTDLPEREKELWTLFIKNTVEGLATTTNNVIKNRRERKEMPRAKGKGRQRDDKRKDRAN